MRQYTVIVGTDNIDGEFITFGSFGPFSDSDQARNFSSRVERALPDAVIQYVDHVSIADLDSFVQEVIDSGDLEPITGSGASEAKKGS